MTRLPTGRYALPRFLALFHSGGSFTSPGGAVQRLYLLSAQTLAEALAEAPTLIRPFEREERIDVGAIDVIEATEVKGVDLTAWRAAQREAEDRATYERLQAKYGSR